VRFHWGCDTIGWPIRNINFFSWQWIFAFDVYLVFPLLPIFFYQYWLWVTHRMSYKRQERLTLREHLSSPRYFGGARVLQLLVFCVVILVYLFSCPHSVSCAQCCLCPWIFHSWIPLRFSLKFMYDTMFTIIPFLI